MQLGVLRVGSLFTHKMNRDVLRQVLVVAESGSASAAAAGQGGSTLGAAVQARPEAGAMLPVRLALHRSLSRAPSAGRVACARCRLDRAHSPPAVTRPLPTRSRAPAVGWMARARCQLDRAPPLPTGSHAHAAGWIARAISPDQITGGADRALSCCAR